MFGAGKLDQRITVQQKQVVRNPSNGEESVAWQDVATVWAEAVPLRGNAFFSANQQQHTVDVRFRVRNRAGLAVNQRVIWRGLPYDITSLIPGTGNYQGITEVMAINGVLDGR